MAMDVVVIKGRMSLAVRGYYGFIECSFIFILLSLAPLQGISAGPLVPDEQRLYERIMGSYVRAVKPVVQGDVPLQVLFSIRLKQIVDLDERQQVLTTNVFIDQTWVDSALAWNTSEFSDVPSLRIPADQIWKPDTFIYNNADNGSTGFISGKFIQIRHNGAVTWPVPVRLRSSCVVKIAYFPFDYQRCLVQFGSWIYSHQFMDYTIRPDAVSVDLATYINNSEWELLSMTMEKTTSQRSRSSNIHPFLTMTIYLRRNTFFYLFNIIVPCIMLSMLTLMTFWLPPTSGEKVTLGLSVFLAFSMFMLLIADEVPASSDAVPIIGIYLCVVMTMTSLSVILAVLVTNLYHRGTKLRPAPRWCANLFIRILAVPFAVSRDVQLLATSIILPDYCRFFLIHNKFDFPNYNIYAYNIYSENNANDSKKKETSGASRKQKRKSRIGPSTDEGQRYVFDHHDSQNRRSGIGDSRCYTSGKRRHMHQGDKLSHCSRRKSFRKTRAEYMNVSCENSEGLEDSCTSETDVDDTEKNVKKSRRHSHCSLQHLCDNGKSTRKGIVSPLTDVHTKQQKRQHSQDATGRTQETSYSNGTRDKYDAMDSSSFSPDDENIQMVTVDMSPAGATVDKTFPPFMEQTPPSTFSIYSGSYTSPIKRRRQLIKTVKDYTESIEYSQTNSATHSGKTSTPVSPVKINSLLSSDCPSSSHKNHHTSSPKNSVTKKIISHCSDNVDICVGNGLVKAGNSSSNRICNESPPQNSNGSLSRAHSSNETALNSHVPTHHFSSNSRTGSNSLCSNNHTDRRRTGSPVSRTSNRKYYGETKDKSRMPDRQDSTYAKLQTLPNMDHLLLTDETFCQCSSDSQDGVWVPYDISRNPQQEEVWCLRDDFRSDDGALPCDDEHHENDAVVESDVYTPFTHDFGNVYLDDNKGGVSRRSKHQNSLKQQYTEQFMDERSKLILAKARLVMAEWQTIAAVIDRLLFLVALFATIFAYVFLLVIVPNDHELNAINMSHTLTAGTGKYNWNTAA